MEGSVASSSKHVRAPAEGKGTNRKYWTMVEELALISAVKELIVLGWKAGNGWRPGFYNQVAVRVMKQIPTCTVRGDPHVLSKISVWKKDYSALRGLFGRSGQGIDPDDYSLTVIGTPAWEESVKLNPDLERLRKKTFPHFEEWKEIFGQDRANGAAAHDLGSTVQQILQEEEERANMNPPPQSFQNGQANGVDDDTLSGDRTPAQSSTSKQPISRKRKGKVSLDDDPFANMMGTFMMDTKEALADLSQAIRSLKEVDPTVGKVFAALEELPHFTTDEQVVAANKIAASPTGLTLFFTMRTEAKVSFVRNVLKGNI